MNRLSTGGSARADAAPKIVLGVLAQPVQEKLPGFDEAEGHADG